MTPPLMPGLRVEGAVLHVDLPRLLAAAGWPDDPAHRRRLQGILERTARRYGARQITWTPAADPEQPR